MAKAMAAMATYHVVLVVYGGLAERQGTGFENRQGSKGLRGFDPLTLRK